jgi:hypothetical protein
MRGVGPFDTREHTTYTEEESNSLAPVDVARFLAKLRGDLLDDELTDREAGARSHREGPVVRDLERGRRWDPQHQVDKRVVIVTRSPTLGDEVMDTTKTDLHQCLTLSLQHLEVPRWHVDTCCSARPRPRGWNP